MRETLFRGKDKNGVWQYGYLVKSKTAFDDNQHVIISIKNHFQLSSTPSGNLCFSESETRVNKVIPETIGQLRHENEHGRYFDGDVYYHAGYGNEVVSGLCQIQLALMSGENDDIGKIIGNIFDNPELMDLEPKSEKP